MTEIQITMLKKIIRKKNLQERRNKHIEKNVEVKDEEINRCREKNERERAMERRGMVDDVRCLEDPHLH